MSISYNMSILHMSTCFIGITFFFFSYFLFFWLQKTQQNETILKEQHQRELKELEERLLQKVQHVQKDPNIEKKRTEKRTEKKNQEEPKSEIIQKRGPVLDERLLQKVKTATTTAEQQHHARNSTVMPANWNKYTDDTYERNYYVNEKVSKNYFLLL